MKTLGIDPGTAITGFGIVEDNSKKLKAISYGCIRTGKNTSPHERLFDLHSKLEEIIKDFKPDYLAVEKLFFSNNSKTAISVGEARGVVLLSAARCRTKVAEYTPLQVKMAVTGYGRADKRQIQYMVKTLLGLEETPKPDDAADALAIAICHLHSYNMEKI